MAGALMRMWRDRVFYALVMPFAALTILFGIWPILLSVEMSFTASATAQRAAPPNLSLAHNLAVHSDPLLIA